MWIMASLWTICRDMTLIIRPGTSAALPYRDIGTVARSPHDSCHELDGAGLGERDGHNPASRES
jgi:hypothetical protein